ncbi:VOC family protein [Galbibacter pacificus]|uniref:VOC family protein n=1 Tax=Galbibacter pacificus TaxID=2996052 RepID=A0ABT6FR16_9FLAO|nr:VOC family protein [Galbibacter pacificus]MDG3581821.1 VOC family protein [Galbibacter pacificus]MDG3585705.1 VOC family protein [Galbibacter pacificus]
MKEVIKTPEQNKVYIRYIVNDVEESIDFYTQFLGFTVKMHSLDNSFAMLESGSLYLLLNIPGQGGAGQAKHSQMVQYLHPEDRIEFRYG